MILQTTGGMLTDLAKSAESLGRDDVLLELKDDRLLTMIKGIENTSMFAARIPDKGVEKYERRGEDILGLPANKIIDFSPKKNENVQLTYEDHKFSLSNGDYTATFNAVNEDYIEGSMDNTIDIEWPIDVTGQFEEVGNFIGKASNIVGEETFIVGGREDGLYLMSKLDDSELHTRIPWDDFDKTNLDWSHSDSSVGDKASDSVFSTEFFKNLYFPSDASGGFRMNFGEGCPLRVIAQKSGGVDFVYILTPRVSTESNSRIMSIPDRVTQQYD